jgi:hypothetical protein
MISLDSIDPMDLLQMLIAGLALLAGGVLAAAFISAAFERRKSGSGRRSRRG